MSDHETFRLAMTVLDTLISDARPGEASSEGEATWRPDGRLEMWDSLVPREVRAKVGEVLRAIGAAHQRRTRLGKTVTLFELTHDEVDWIERSAEATGDRLRPQEHAVDETEETF